MSAAVWALLSEPFPRAASAWRVVEVSDDLQTAKVERTLTTSAITARLDAAVGAEQWSFQLLPLGERSLVCNLTVAGVGRAGVASVSLPATASMPVNASELAELALAAAAARFGMHAEERTATAETVPSASRLGVAAGSDSEQDDDTRAWVDFDAERGVPLYVPEDDLLTSVEGGLRGSIEQAPVRSSFAQVPAGERGGAEARGDASGRPAGHEVIERLLDRLREEGLGKEAARLVVAYGGYGRDQDEARELYGKLRALLKGSVVAAT